MKSIFVAGSRKFFQDVEKFIELCKENNIEAANAGKVTDEEDSYESEKAALFGAFELIDKSYILYIIANDGYIGKTVALEIAYAFAKGKEIISSEELEDFSVRALVSKIMKLKEMIKYAKSS